MPAGALAGAFGLPVVVDAIAAVVVAAVALFRRAGKY
jgi:hypothetical protein